MARPDNPSPDGNEEPGGNVNPNRVNVQATMETREEGRQLFVHFMYDQIQAENVTPPMEIAQAHAQAQAFAGGDQLVVDAASVPDGYSNPDWERAGGALRHLADEFAKSRGRQRVRDEADQIKISQITQEGFTSFLQTYFAGGDNPQERIVTLFFFCSDLVIRSIKENVTQFANKIFEWSVKYILNIVCNWVEEHGGWSAVLGTFFENITMNLQKVAATLFVCILAVGAAMSIWKGGSSK